MVLVTLAAQLANFGSRDHLLRTFSREPSALREAWRRNVATRAWLLIPGPVLFLAMGWSPVAASLMTVWLVSTFLTRSHDPVVVYRRAFGFALLVEVVATGATGAVVVVLGSSLTSDGLIATFALVGLLRAGWIAVRFGLAGLPARLTWPDVGELRRSWPFFLLTFSGAVQSRVDLYVVAALLPAAALGTYGVLTSFVLLTQSTSAGLLAPIVPQLYRLPRARVLTAAARLVVIGLPVSLASIGVTWLCLELLYGIELPTATLGAAWAAMLPSFLYAPLVYLWFRDARPNVVVAGSIVGALIGVAVAVALVPGLGIAGAMIAAATGQAAIAGFHVLAVLRSRSPRGLPGTGSSER
jgi:O-antigen/teichoic acid export membrane protein